MRRHLVLAALAIAASMLLVPRTCNSRNSTAHELTVAVASHDSTAHLAKLGIQEQRTIAGRAARAATTLRRRARVSVELSAERLQDDTVMVAILAAKDSALALGDIQAAALETALDLSELRAAEADSLLHVSLDVVQHPCRIARFLPCPSRTAAAIIGAVAVVAIGRRR